MARQSLRVAVCVLGRVAVCVRAFEFACWGVCVCVCVVACACLWACVWVCVRVCTRERGRRASG
jgi:hypothetical protein